MKILWCRPPAVHDSCTRSGLCFLPLVICHNIISNITTLPQLVLLLGSQWANHIIISQHLAKDATY